MTQTAYRRSVSASYPVERGVKQRSVLSPALFLFVIRQLQATVLGVSINNHCAGGFIHADDIRNLATNVASLEAQMAVVKKFAERNFLR